MNAIIPIPKIDVGIRPGTMEDIPFLDSLQKMHTKQVGWMPTKQFEGKIKLGHVLIAEEGRGVGLRVGVRVGSEEEPDHTLTPTPNLNRPSSPLGYLIGNDQYFKHDDIGIIYQMNVVPGHQRGLIGASLLKAQFERSAYGCKLYCCWCAQDIEANYFWESMGFVALAFRSGSRAKDRVHIFWQKRIRSGDVSTPFWFPSQTGGGAIREDRLVLPIPPGVRWSDEMPRILPGGEATKTLEDQTPKRIRRPARGFPESKIQNATPAVIQKPVSKSLGGWGFSPPPPPPPVKPEKPANVEKKPRVKVKNDPKLVAAARELRDRWLEKVNDDPLAFSSSGKYDVARALPEGNDASIEVSVNATPILPAPAIVRTPTDVRSDSDVTRPSRAIAA